MPRPARLARAARFAAALLFVGVAVGWLSGPPLAAADAAPTLVDSQAFLAVHLPAAPAPAAPLSSRVRSLLSRMTLREKVGQMTQLTLAMVTTGATGTAQELRIDPEKLHKAVVEYGVGSILNCQEQALPVARWHELLRDIQAAAAQTRLRIPVLYGIDSIHGPTYVKGATLFPQPLGMAATWNPELMLAGSRITAAETRAAGIPWNFSPVLDIGRQPLWPRLYETLGEDPYLGSVMGVATVRGYQGDADGALAGPLAVAATLKHYAGYSLPTTGHDRTPALIPEITLRQYVLPAFAAAVRAGAASVMVNSGEVNGVPGHANRWLLEDVLRGELGFTGMVVSDWEDIKKLATVHRVAADEKEATRIAVLAGIDMSMVPLDLSFADLLVKLVEEGAVPMARIDQAVGRILTLKERLGLFEDPLLGSASKVEVGGAGARAVALEAARQSIILLANKDAMLPLQTAAASGGHKAISRLLVTGPTADSRAALNNGWSIVWQGSQEELYPTDRPTVRGALAERFGAERVVYVPGAAYDQEVDVAAAVAAAKQADVAVVCLGELAYAETPGNIDDLDLPEAQLRLARAVAETGTPTVLVLVEGRPRIVRPLVAGAKAIVLALNPGLEGGRAIAEVLAGDVNPSGRLPITYPRYANALLNYDHKAYEEQDQSFGLTAYQSEFSFGSGLSYTTYDYSRLLVEPPSVAPGGEVKVSVTVRNSGSRA
ncbi:MAG TPA: glycoside hydrolase family 3 N-terminal domain-containing protein, partial [Thermoanaerobaculia bacterium]|nr:glycoside hydrolase family 3 N-terminal domain-containing protein [Thermoanaerobaculia bacterium]